MDAISDATAFAWRHKEVLKAIAKGRVNPTAVCKGLDGVM